MLLSLLTTSKAAFTIKEIRELTAISDVTFDPVDPSFFPNNLKQLPRARKRIAELLLKASKASQSSSKTLPKSFSLDFLLSPIHFNAQDGDPNDRLNSITFQHQTYADGADPFDPTASTTPIQDKQTTLKTTLAFRSIGYKSTPLPGLSDIGIQFDTRRGIIPNERGRVVVYPTSQPGIDVIPQTLPGLYVAGWVKRGPTGVIASTMEDAFATADCITQDVDAGHPFLNGRLDEKVAREGWRGVLRDVQDQGVIVRRTDWEDWRAIDKTERERGARMGKEREKITSVDDMLKLLG
jgi:adrenodoxin-NADP+ reductase